METREIKDAEGNVVVTVSLPSGTSEEIWNQVLSAYVINEGASE